MKIARQKVKSSRVEGEDQGALNGIIDCRNDVAPVRFDDTAAPTLFTRQFRNSLQRKLKEDPHPSLRFATLLQPKWPKCIP